MSSFTQADHLRRLWPTLLALTIVALAWLSTLQTTIGAANDPFLDPSGLVDPLMDDSGEFVVAWHTWGVSHPPGYPLLNATANVATRAMGVLGFGGVTSASLVSFLSALSALAILAWLVGRAGGNGWGPPAAVLLAGCGLMTWLYASVAEAYALGLLLAFGLVALAVRVGDSPTRRGALALGLVAGLAVGHHRTLLALLPAVVFAAWPARRLGRRVWLAAGGVALASLAVYLYLPLAAVAGSPWVYGRSPATWDGFWDAVLAREYGAQLAPPLAPRAMYEALNGRFGFLAKEMSWLAFFLGALGLAGALRAPATRRVGALLALVVGGFVFAPVGQYLVIGTHLLVMTAALAACGLWGLAMASLDPQRQRTALLAALFATAAAATIGFSQHHGRVAAYSRDPLGERIVAAAAALPGASPTLVEAWGPRYFALAAGKWVDRRLDRVRLVDARGDLSGLPPRSELPATVYTTQDFLHLAAPERWAERWGTAVFPSSAGDGLVALRARPAPPPAESPLPRIAARTYNGDLALEGGGAWREGGDVRVRLAWRALRRPTLDYQVFVKVRDADGRVLAQGDRASPVYGFHPTRRWQAGERVADDFRVALPPGGRPLDVAVGLYTTGPDGAFVDHLVHYLDLGAPPDGRSVVH